MGFQWTQPHDTVAEFKELIYLPSIVIFEKVVACSMVDVGTSRAECILIYNVPCMRVEGNATSEAIRGSR